jgi:hypothetical protein
MDAIIFIHLGKRIALRAILYATISAKAVYMAIYWRSVNLIEVELSHCIAPLNIHPMQLSTKQLPKGNGSNLAYPLTVLHFKHCHDTVPLTAS